MQATLRKQGGVFFKDIMHFGINLNESVRGQM